MLDDSVDDEKLKAVINRYLKKIYPLVFYLTGNDSDKAYQITVSSYVEAFMSLRSIDDEDQVFIKIVQQAIVQSQSATVMPSSKVPPFKNVPPGRIPILHILSKALQALPFKDRALLLLREQLHLSYQNIASVFGISQADARSHINKARVQLRKKAEEAMQ